MDLNWGKTTQKAESMVEQRGREEQKEKMLWNS